MVYPPISCEEPDQYLDLLYREHDLSTTATPDNCRRLLIRLGHDPDTNSYFGRVIEIHEARSFTLRTGDAF